MELTVRRVMIIRRCRLVVAGQHVAVDGRGHVGAGVPGALAHDSERLAGPDFPAPVGAPGGVGLWKRDEVERWIAERDPDRRRRRD